MLRELILLRHAKAEPLAPGGTDFERRLTTQGEHDAERIGTLLAEAGAKPTRALSSPAPRAQATAERALAALGKAPLETDPEIFDATPSALLEVLARHRDAAQVLLVGHNPGISELASLLLHGRSEESRALPTAGYAWLSLRADTPLEPGTATLTRYGSARG
jgi:phosphohistidine phosphatase SixA